MTNNFLWASDLHLDHLNNKKYSNFITKIQNECTNNSILLITGDTTVGQSIIKHHYELAKACSGKMLFVLGNHDRWNSSFLEVNDDLNNYAKHMPNAYFLDQVDYFKIESSLFVVGDSGWYDGRNGLQQQIRFYMNDWSLINELIGHNPFHINAYFADICAKRLEEKINLVIKKGADRVIILTHVPPYVETCRYLGQPSDDFALPWFSSKCMGDMLDHVAEKFTHIKFEVLSGHTHESFDYKRKENLIVHVASARYGDPQINKWQPTLW
jgi:predicted MPP superfamily phosphohydrolase